MTQISSTSKKYAFCILFPNGNKKVFKTNLSTSVCLTFAGIWDLVESGVIKFGYRDTLEVKSSIPNNFLFLKPLYDYICKCKNVRYNKIIEGFVLTFQGLLDEYISSVIDALVRENHISPKVKIGFFKSETITPPRLDSFENMIQTIESGVINTENVADDMIVLSSLLMETSFFKNYYTRDQIEIIADKMNNIKKVDHCKLVDKFVYEIYDVLLEILKSIS